MTSRVNYDECVVLVSWNPFIGRLGLVELGSKDVEKNDDKHATSVASGHISKTLI